MIYENEFFAMTILSTDRQQSWEKVILNLIYIQKASLTYSALVALDF